MGQDASVAFEPVTPDVPPLGPCTVCAVRVKKNSVYMARLTDLRAIIIENNCVISLIAQLLLCYTESNSGIDNGSRYRWPEAVLQADCVKHANFADEVSLEAYVYI